MSEPTDRDESIPDLEPQEPETQEVKDEDADALKGGRKAGGGQQEYFP
jgi:hypothetical protein